MRNLVTVVAVTAVAVAAAATARAGNPIQDGVLVLRVTDTPVFLPVTQECPVERLHTPLRDVEGQVIGSNDVCYTSAVAAGPTETLGLDETFHVPGGMIATRQTLVLVFGANGVAAVTSHGTVTRSTGVYLGNTGTVVGAGTIAAEPDGTVLPDLTFVIGLG